MRKLAKLIPGLIILSLLSSCEYLHPYTPTLQQGNVIKPSRVKQLKVGMSAAEVNSIMGTPILVNTFSDNTWNYVYTIHRWGQKVHEKRVIVSFSNGRVTHIES